jgi:3-isopropylmalate/(R)-2-methylmalate dehydratase small subunit
MIKFTAFESKLVRLPIDNIDTDQIIPARFLKTITKDGLADQLFFDWRYDANGQPKADFVLNTAAAKACQILLAGDNFGCGSSREHAPWALTQYGFRAVISTSFADIFKQNSLKNSLLPIVVSKEVHAALMADPIAVVKVDLGSQSLELPGGKKVQFSIDPFSRHCLLEGIDELGYILQQAPAIAEFEAGHPAWINTLT